MKDYKNYTTKEYRYCPLKESHPPHGKKGLWVSLIAGLVVVLAAAITVTMFYLAL